MLPIRMRSVGGFGVAYKLKGMSERAVQIRDSTDIDHELMDICWIYTDSEELNRHSCRIIQS